MAHQTSSFPAQPSKARPHLRGLRTLFTLQAFRRVVQIASAGFIAVIAIQSVAAGEGGSSVSVEAFCPLGGLETFYRFITSGGAFVSHTHLSNLVLGAAVLITALLLRSAFCGWICPFGFLQDLVSNLRNVLNKRLPGLRRWFARMGKFSFWAFLDRYLRFAKYLVLAWAVGGAAYFGTMVFRDVDPWSALIHLAEFSFTPGVVVLALTLVAAFFVDRPWCRYACPLGAASGLLGMLSPVHLRRQEAACTSCKLCTRSCPMGLKVHEIKSVHHPDCIGCLECVESCPRSGAMEIKLDLPLSNR